MGSKFVMNHYLLNENKPEKITEKVLDGYLDRADGIFETMRLHGGKLFLLDNHLERFYKGAISMSIDVPGKNELLSALRELIHLNPKAKVLRFAAIIAEVPDLDIESTLLFSFEDEYRYSEDMYSKGLKVKTSVLKNTKGSSSIKTLELRKLLVYREEAGKEGFDDCLFIDKNGFITDTSVANIFWITKNMIFFPPGELCLLKGVTRQFIIKSIPEAGALFCEKPAKLKALETADEIFLTNSIIGVMPVTELSLSGKARILAVGHYTKTLKKLYENKLLANLAVP